MLVVAVQHRLRVECEVSALMLLSISPVAHTSKRSFVALYWEPRLVGVTSMKSTRSHFVTCSLQPRGSSGAALRGLPQVMVVLGGRQESSSIAFPKRSANLASDAPAEDNNSTVVLCIPRYYTL